MAYTRTFEGFSPPRRYDGLPFTQALIREAATEAGSYSTIETKVLVPVDADPSEPASRNFTTALATLATGWYIVRWQDAGGSMFDSDPIFYPSAGEAADSFITVEELGDFLGEDLSASDKALQCVDAACDIVRIATEQTISLVEDDEIVLDGPGTDALLLPEFPVTEVTEVTYTPAPPTLPTETLVVDEDYRLNGNGILLRVDGGRWTSGRQNWVVTYSHGYVDLPRDLRQVAIELAARLFKQAGGAVYETLGAYSVRYAGPAADLSNSERMILRKYKRTK